MRENLVLNSKEDTISELQLYRRAGGGAMCDVAPKGLRYVHIIANSKIDCGLLMDRYNPEVLPEISRESGVKIVAGTAYYVDPLIPEQVKSMTVEQVC